ncbi:MAG TPA: hypothetical protein VMU61_00105 [Candidatus Aquilonibacter sp.]|nr:hypothetical protein [Candidatus Aquilonibacter sp.]
MTAIKRLMIVGVSAALTAFPLSLGAITANRCKCGKPTAASYTWNFHREANTLFDGIQTDAQHATNHAAKLQSFAYDSNITWQLDANQLTQIKSEVDDMGKKLCRLEIIRRVVSPWQQKTIDRIADNLQFMADNTQDAILYVNGHQQDLMNPTYRMYANNLYSEGSNLSQSVGDAVEYAKVRHEYRELRDEVGAAPIPS